MVRNDTGKINSSPRAITYPVLRLQQGCNNIIVLAVSDPDDDIIWCRWALGTEFAGICSKFSMNNESFPYEIEFFEQWQHFNTDEAKAGKVFATFGRNPVNHETFLLLNFCCLQYKRICMYIMYIYVCRKLQKLSERKVLRFTGFHPNLVKLLQFLLHLY